MIKHEYLYVTERLLGLKRAIIDASVNGNNTLIPAVSGRILRIYQILLVSSGTATATFQSGAGGTPITGPIPLAANTGFATDWNPYGHFQTAEGALLNLSLSAGVGVGGWLTYAEV